MKIRTTFLPAMLLAVWWLAAPAVAQPTVWTGPTTTFTKAPFEDPLPKDELTANVALTRGSSGGLYNVAQEAFYDLGVSPVDTEWATSLGNPTETIAATNWAALAFTDWRDAYGGMLNLSTNITQLDAVVHLVSDDIYLDLRFTDWSEMPSYGAGFSYDRSTPSAVPEPMTLALVTLGALLLFDRRERGEKWKECGNKGMAR